MQQVQLVINGLFAKMLPDSLKVQAILLNTPTANAAHIYAEEITITFSRAYFPVGM